jgi:hypothetical protein
MQRLTNFWHSSVDLHMCALGGATNVETILHLLPSVLQHHQIWWPRRPCDRTPSPSPVPLDFFLWGYIKDLVYQTKVQDVAELHHQITAACETVTPVMLQNTWREVEYRLDICRATKGAHVKIYWGMPKVSECLHPSVKFPCVYLS